MKNYSRTKEAWSVRDISDNFEAINSLLWFSFISALLFFQQPLEIRKKSIVKIIKNSVFCGISQPYSTLLIKFVKGENVGNIEFKGLAWKQKKSTHPKSIFECFNVFYRFLDIELQLDLKTRLPLTDQCRINWIILLRGFFSPQRARLFHLEAIVFAWLAHDKFYFGI